MATSTLVVMILGVLIIGGGVVLLRQLMTSSEDAVNSLNNDQLAAIHRLLANGQLVATFPSNQVIVAGKTGVFGVGIVNKLDADKTFTVNVKVRDDAGALSNDLLVGYLPTVNVQKSSEQDIKLSVKPDASASGTYTVLVNITYPDAANQQRTYDSVRFFTVRVQ